MFSVTEAAKFQLDLEHRSIEDFLGDIHFWLKLGATIFMTAASTFWVMTSFENTSLNMMEYKSAFLFLCPSFTILLNMQILHYLFRWDTDFSGIILSFIGSYTLIPLGGQITSALLYVQDKSVIPNLIILLVLVECGGILLLIDTILYKKLFFKTIEVVTVKINSENESK